MSRDARWKALLELLVERGRLEVEQAAAELEVSPATIRRDFYELAEQQMLVRTRAARSSTACRTNCRCATRPPGTPRRSSASRRRSPISSRRARRWA